MCRDVCTSSTDAFILEILSPGEPSTSCCPPDELSLIGNIRFAVRNYFRISRKIRSLRGNKWYASVEQDLVRFRLADASRIVIIDTSKCLWNVRLKACVLCIIGTSDYAPAVL